MRLIPQAATRVVMGIGFVMMPLSLSAFDYPSRPIRIIVTFPPGGSMDTVIRLLGQELVKSWKQPVVVENRPGASTVVGVALAAKASPDGYTLVGVASSFAANHTLISKLPYDSLRDFRPVGSLTREPHGLVGNPSVPARNLHQLIAYAKANPDQLSYASPGNGTGQHLAFELLKSSVGIKVLHVPYKGNAPAMTAVMGGEINLAMGNLSVFAPQIRAGKLKGLGVSSARRSPIAPEIPTIAEQGLPGFETYAWFGLLAPSAVPDIIVSRLNGEIIRAFSRVEVRNTLASRGLEPILRTPQEYGMFLRAEIGRFAKIIKEANIRTE